MPITKTYGPSAKAAGGAARAAGAGITRVEDRRRAEDKAFRADQARVAQDLNRENMLIQIGERQQGRDDARQMEQMRQEGRVELQEGAQENWEERYTFTGRKEIEKINEAITRTMNDPSWGPPGEMTPMREQALQQLKARRDGIPKVPQPPQDSPFAPDQQPGMMWTDDEGNQFTRDEKGNPKIMFDARAHRLKLVEYKFKMMKYKTDYIAQQMALTGPEGNPINTDRSKVIAEADEMFGDLDIEMMNEKDVAPVPQVAQPQQGPPPGFVPPTDMGPQDGAGAPQGGQPGTDAIPPPPDAGAGLEAPQGPPEAPQRIEAQDIATLEKWVKEGRESKRGSGASWKGTEAAAQLEQNERDLKTARGYYKKSRALAKEQTESLKKGPQYAKHKFGDKKSGIPIAPDYIQDVYDDMDGLEKAFKAAKTEQERQEILARIQNYVEEHPAHFNIEGPEGVPPREFDWK